MIKNIIAGTIFLALALTGCGNQDKKADVKPVEGSSQKNTLSQESPVNITGITVRNDRKTGADVKKEEIPLLNISQVFQQAEKLNGKQIRLIVFDGIRSGDSTERIPPLMTRSDGYVHDEHGTLVLRIGWQYSNRYNEMARENPDAVLVDDNIRIEKGRWEITPYVYYKNGMIMLSLKEMR